MTHSLDTNLCIAYMRGKNAHVQLRFAQLGLSNMTLCAPVIGELRFGALNGNDPIKEVAKVESFIAKFPCLDFDEPSTREYANIRLDLTRRGVLISEMDLLIASIALAYDLTLVTHNTAEFSRVKGLRIEDWEIP